MQNEFKQYRRKAIAELRSISEEELLNGLAPSISVSQEDLNNGSPCALDMIARNPLNHNDQWLVAAQYFHDNFEKIGGA